MKNSIFFSICVCVALFFTGCQSKKVSDFSEETNGKKVTLTYAKGFDITHYPTYTDITVYNPWKKGEILTQYFLVKHDSIQTPDNNRKIQIPISTMMANSATYFGFLEMLGEIEKVTGVCNSQYIYNASILKGVAEGKIKELGESYNLDIENLIMLHPQVVMTTAYNAEDENTKRLKQSGLNVVFNVEWMEHSVLGRAEWIKFMGEFFDKGALADSLFQEVDKNYQNLKEMVAATEERPTIFSGQDFRGTWSMAGGNSYTAELFRDAKADYHFANDSTTSISGTIEQAMMLFSKADLWIGVNAASREELKQFNPKYAIFDAFKNGKVWNNIRRCTPSGGNDYWESGVARPDLLLKDMIKICHPDLLPEYEMTYYEQLK